MYFFISFTMYDLYQVFSFTMYDLYQVFSFTMYDLYQVFSFTMYDFPYPSKVMGKKRQKKKKSNIKYLMLMPITS